jgi:hypothetical protein
VNEHATEVALCKEAITFLIVRAVFPCSIIYIFKMMLNNFLNLYFPKISWARLVVLHWEHTTVQIKCHVTALRVLVWGFVPNSTFYVKNLCGRLSENMSNGLLRYYTLFAETVTKPYPRNRGSLAHAFDQAVILLNIYCERMRRIRCGFLSNKELSKDLSTRLCTAVRH